MEALKNETYKGYKIVVGYDYDTKYSDYEHLGTFYTNVPRLFNPENHDIDEVFDDGIFDDSPNFKENLIFLKVYAYVHGGIALSTKREGQFADPFDSGWAGVMACTKKQASEWFMGSLNENQAKEQLESEVEELDHFARGEVYEYEIIDGDGCHVESFNGFFDIEEAISHAKQEIDNSLH